MIFDDWTCLCLYTFTQISLLFSYHFNEMDLLKVYYGILVGPVNWKISKLNIFGSSHCVSLLYYFTTLLSSLESFFSQTVRFGLCNMSGWFDILLFLFWTGSSMKLYTEGISCIFDVIAKCHSLINTII